MGNLENTLVIKAAAIAGCLYALTSLMMVAWGIPIKIPWELVIFLGIMALPFAYFMAIGGSYLQENLKSKRAIKLCGIATGIFLLLVYRLDSQILISVGLSLFIFSFWHCLRKNIRATSNIVSSFMLIVACYGFIANLNFLALKLVIQSLNDVFLRELDLYVYNMFLDNPANYHGIFPLIKSDFLFGLFQNAYSMLFFGVFLSAILIAHRREPIRFYFSVLFGCYLAGLVIFLIFPAVGPCIYFPESFAAQYHGSMTHMVIIGFLNGYESVKQGAIKEAGVGYFVAFPSLHVAVAIVLQYFSIPSLFHFWMMVPINAAIVISTVFLGYHYLVDIPAGIFLALSSILFFKNIVFKNLQEPTNYIYPTHGK